MIMYSRVIEDGNNYLRKKYATVLLWIVAVPAEVFTFEIVEYKLFCMSYIVFTIDYR